MERIVERAWGWATDAEVMEYLRPLDGWFDRHPLVAMMLVPLVLPAIIIEGAVRLAVVAVIVAGSIPFLLFSLLRLPFRKRRTAA